MNIIQLNREVFALGVNGEIMNLLISDQFTGFILSCFLIAGVVSMLSVMISFGLQYGHLLGGLKMR